MQMFCSEMSWCWRSLLCSSASRVLLLRPLLQSRTNQETGEVQSLVFVSIMRNKKISVDELIACARVCFSVRWPSRPSSLPSMERATQRSRTPARGNQMARSAPWFRAQVTAGFDLLLLAVVQSRCFWVTVSFLLTHKRLSTSSFIFQIERCIKSWCRRMKAMLTLQ